MFTSVTQTCNGLAERGWDVHLAFSMRPEAPKDFKRYLDQRVVMHPLTMVREVRPTADIVALLHLIRLFRRLRPDIVHLHSSKAGALGRLAGRIVGIPDRLFYSPRGFSFLRQDIGRIERWLYRVVEYAAAFTAGHVIACSASELEVFAKQIGSGRASLIENAIDVNAVQCKAWNPNMPIVVGTSGRITPARSPAAFARLAHHFKAQPVRFVWIGGGEDEAGGSELRAAGVQQTGWLPRNEALQRLAELDIYLQTSLWEGMPLSVIEAQTAGIPAVVTDVVGNRDIVCHKVTGYVAKDHDEFVDAIERLVCDDDLRNRMGLRAREVCLKRFSLSRYFDELIACYGNIMCGSQ